MWERDVYDRRGERLIRTEFADPVCGRDFCDKCGDCLACYGDDDCTGGQDTGHWWVVYADEPHGAATVGE